MTHVTDLVYAVWAYLNSVWTDITADVITGSVAGRDGFATNSPVDRVADVGEFSFTLKNFTGKYSPGHASALSGWHVGIPVKIVFTYKTQNYPIFGRIATPGGIEIDPRQKGMPTVSVTCLDWFDFASKHPIVNPGILTDKTADEVITQTLLYTPIAPQAVSLDTGVFTFPTVFDTVTSKTKAYSELAKSALAEMGYVYMRHDTTYGGTLVLENHHRRNGLRAETTFDEFIEDAGIELREDGGYELREDGGYELCENWETGTFDGDNTFISADISHGDNLLNRLGNFAYPRSVDTSPQILFSLAQPIQVPGGGSITIKGYYADPNGGAPINAQNMIDPVATTDYLAAVNQDGTGTNYTANISVVASYGTEGFTHVVSNSGTSAWLYQFNCRGYGIYTYNPIEHTESALQSIQDNGVNGKTLHQKYQKTLMVAELASSAIVEFDREPETRIDRIYAIANQSPNMMGAFLNLGTGDLIRLKSTLAAIDGYHYICGREWKIEKGRLIMFSWTTKAMLSLRLGLSMLGMEVSENFKAVTYHHDPALIPMKQYSMSVWLNYKSSPSTGYFHFFGLEWHPIVATRYSWAIGIQEQKIFYRRSYTDGIMGGDLDVGEWQHATPVSANDWHQVVITHDGSVNERTKPKMYIDGAEVAIPDAIIDPDALYFSAMDGGLGMQVGFSQMTPTVYLNMQVVNPRIYNRILSAANVSELYAAGKDDTTTQTTGVVFWPLNTKTKWLNWTDLYNSDMKPVDNIYGYAGNPSGTPIYFHPFDGARNTVTVDASSVATTANGTTSTFAHTISAGNDRMLIVAISKRAFNNATSVTYGGESLRRYYKNRYDNNNYPQFELWYLPAPPVGTANVVVTIPANDWFEVNAISFFGADQIYPFRNFDQTTGTGTGPALTIDSVSTDIVFDILAIEKGSDTTCIPTAGQTQRMNASADSNWAGLTSTKPGAASVSTGWTISASGKNWIYASVSIQGSIP